MKTLIVTLFLLLVLIIVAPVILTGLVTFMSVVLFL